MRKPRSEARKRLCIRPAPREYFKQQAGKARKMSIEDRRERVQLLLKGLEKAPLQQLRYYWSPSRNQFLCQIVDNLAVMKEKTVVTTRQLAWLETLAYELRAA